MRKTPNLFLRDANGRLTDEVNPLAQWVVDGEGYPTVKYDGTAVRVTADGKLWARYDCKRGKTPPPSFEPCQDPDPVTGHWPGWILADRPEDKWIREAERYTREAIGGKWSASVNISLFGYATFEACGPRIGGNPQGLTNHQLLRHGVPYGPVGRTKADLYASLSTRAVEGIVFWRSAYLACDKVKIRAVDLGLPWGSRGAA